MELVEQQRADAAGAVAAQLRVVLDHPGEDAFGDHLDAGPCRHPVLEADAIADRLADGPLDIGIAGGKIAAVGRGLAAEAPTYDARARLACPGLIESHIHIDKSRIIDRCTPQERATLSPVKGVTPLKPAMTVEDVYARAAKTVEQCILHGTTRMRTQVEVDPGIGMRGFEGVQSLIADYRWAIDIEICVFPQEGLISYPGTEELLIEGLERGAKVIGGAPRYDSDQAGQIHRISYEQLTSEPEAEVRRLLAYCNLEFHENCLNFHTTERVVNTPSATQVRQPMYRSAVARWKNYERHLEPLRAALEGVEQEEQTGT